MLKDIIRKDRGKNMKNELMKEIEKLNSKQLELVLFVAKDVQRKYEPSEEDRKRDELREKWYSEREVLKDIPVYERNDTMRKIGNQSLEFTEELLKDYNNVKAAHRDFLPCEDIYDFGRDMLSLGYMYGVREERERRKDK